ncbi:hypothetical protein [Halospeciosus flavus]|uniref:NYN domain-containing protein n=1 Tax=Halospeciosus flavus TaxID=3032283 RepID=A0ABD5Z4W4_9EURY|nr:hypothetical protein [Halospeciosus flavus]
MTARQPSTLTDALGPAGDAIDRLRGDVNDDAALIERTFETVVETVGHDATLYADLSRDLVEDTPANAYDAVTRPDLAVESEGTELVVTVADHDTLADRDVVVSRLEGLRETGADRVLVVPDEESARFDAHNLADVVDGDVTVAVPEEIHALL